MFDESDRGVTMIDKPSKTKSKSELESEISRAMIRFKKEYMGRGPIETRTFLIEDMVLVRFKEVLTPAEI